ncbi:MAG: ABC transporter permease [Gemmatales bacterium]
MKKVFKLAWANLREHPIRVLLTTLATTAAVCLVIWIASGYEALAKTFDEYANLSLGKYTLSIAPISTTNSSPIPDEVLAALRKDPVVLAADPMMIAKLRVTKVHSPSTNYSISDNNPSSELPANAGPNFHGPDYDIVFTDSSEPPFNMVEGSWLGTEASQVVLRKDTATRLGLTVGSEVQVGVKDKQRQFRVIGIVGAPVITSYGVAALPVLTPSSGELFVSSQVAELLTGSKLQPNLIGLSIRPDADLTKFRFSWSPRLSKFSNPVQFQDAHDIEEALDQSASAQNVRLQSYATAGIAMLVSFLVIYCTLTMGVNERSRQFALLRAISFTRSQVAGVITIEALFLGGIGLVTGLLVSGMLMTVIGFQSSTTLYHGIGIGPLGILLSVLVTLGAALPAAILPARSANKLKPLDAIAPQSRSSGSSSLSRFNTIIGFVLILLNPCLAFLTSPSSESQAIVFMIFGFVAMMGGFLLVAPAIVVVADRFLTPFVGKALGLDSRLLTSQITVHLWRTISAALSLATGLGLSIGVYVWGYTMLSAFVPGPWAPDALIAFKPSGIERRHFDDIASIQGFKREEWQPIVVEQPRLAEDVTGSADRVSITRQDNVVIVGIDPQGAFGESHPLLKLEWVAGTPQEAVRQMQITKGCVVPDHFLAESKLKLGDALELIPPESPGKKVEYKIVGAVRLPGWHWQTKLTGFRTRTHRSAALVFANYENVANDFGFQAATHVWFNYDKPTVDHKQLIGLVRDRVQKLSGKKVVIGDSHENENQVHIMPIEGIRAVMLTNAKRWIWVISQVPLLAMVIAGFGVMNVMFAAVRARRWELGVLRSIGFTRAVLCRSIIAEGLLVGIVACFIGLGFGILAGWCGCAFAQHFSFFGGLHPPLVIPWKQISFGLVFTLLLASLIALVPAFIMIGGKPLKLLQEGRSAF